MAETSQNAGFESKPIKGRRGGARPGAGRKPNPLKLMNKPSKEIARTIYEESNPRAIFARLLRSRSDDVVLRTVCFLHEQAFGKAKQAIDVSGGIVHAHTVYRDPRLAALSPEELQALDSSQRSSRYPRRRSPPLKGKSWNRL